MTNIQLAAKLEAAAKEYRKAYLDIDSKMINRDFRNLMGVAKMIRDEKKRSAARKAAGLDTIVREWIPNDVWDFLQPDM